MQVERQGAGVVSGVGVVSGAGVVSGDVGFQPQRQVERQEKS